MGTLVVRGLKKNQSIDLLSKSIDWLLYDEEHWVEKDPLKLQFYNKQTNFEKCWVILINFNPSRPVHFRKLH